MASLLDAFNEPCTRRETSDYGIDEPIMDGPYGDAAAHAAATPTRFERDLAEGRRLAADPDHINAAMSRAAARTGFICQPATEQETRHV